MINRTTAGKITANDIGKLITFRLLQDTYITAPLANFRVTDDKKVKIRINGVYNGTGEQDSLYWSPEYYWSLNVNDWVRIDDEWGEQE